MITLLVADAKNYDENINSMVRIYKWNSHMGYPKKGLLNEKKCFLGLILREKCINIDGNLVRYVVVVKVVA
jgi:hypothetical protein